MRLVYNAMAVFGRGIYGGRKTKRYRDNRKEDMDDRDYREDKKGGKRKKSSRNKKRSRRKRK